MANAKRCDVCGRYYDVPELNDLLVTESLNTSMIRILRRKPTPDRIDHETMQFDACEKCLQGVLDYILTKRAEAEEVTE